MIKYNQLTKNVGSSTYYKRVQVLCDAERPYSSLFFWIKNLLEDVLLLGQNELSSSRRRQRRWRRRRRRRRRTASTSTRGVHFRNENEISRRTRVDCGIRDQLIFVPLGSFSASPLFPSHLPSQTLVPLWR